MRLRRLTYVLLALAAGLLLWSCASIGSPEGGPRDYTPPAVTKSDPKPGTVNFKGNKVKINFDEVVTLNDQQKKVVVSPAQKNQPTIKSLGKTVTVEFNDPLLPNTTYTIDFSDAVQDNNEGNRLENYSFAFSTGDSIDTLQVSGIVLRASDLEPMQGVVVGLQSNLADSAFTTVPLERISRTNDKGQFTIRNLKPGRYHVFALNDLDNNYMMSRNEDYAFIDSIVVPRVARFTSQDTVFTFDRRVDTVFTGHHTEYLPNNLLLSMFNEHYTPLYLKKTERLGRNKLLVQVSGPCTPPRLDILSPAVHDKDWYCLQSRATNDSCVYWITDSSLIKSDSIMVDLYYDKTGPDGVTAQAHDTVNFVLKKSTAELKRLKEEAKEKENMEKDLRRLQEQRDKLVAAGKDPTEVDLNMAAIRKKEHEKAATTFKMAMATKGSMLEVTDSIAFDFDTPVKHIDQSRIRLDVMDPVDSTWSAVATPGLQVAGPYDILHYTVPMRLEPEGVYRLTVDSAAVTSIYNYVNDSAQFNFSVRSLDEYGYIVLHVNSGDKAFVELLDGSEKVVRTARVQQGTVRFDNLVPAQYYARLVIDSNGNGKWDAGDYARHLQPEEVYYFPWPAKLKVRKSWGMEESWNIYEVALDLQKPDKIKRNKPEVKKDSLEKKKNTTGDENQDNDDEFNSTGFGRNTYSGNKYTDYQKNRR